MTQYEALFEAAGGVDPERSVAPCRPELAYFEVPFAIDILAGLSQARPAKFSGASDAPIPAAPPHS